MASETRPLAVVTGASTGIGFELAKCCARDGFDFLVAADETAINQAASQFRDLGVAVDAVEADLAPSRASTSCTALLADARSGLCWPMPDAAWGEAFSIRTSATFVAWSIPILPAPFTCCRRSATTCEARATAAS